MRIGDLSIRFKLPLWGGALIVISALTGGASLMVRAYEDVRQDVVASADSLGRTLAKTLVPALLHEDVWRAYEIIMAPFHGLAAGEVNPAQVGTIVLLDPGHRVVVSNQPRDLPMLAEIAHINPDYAALIERIDGPGGRSAQFFEPGGDNLFFVVPVADEEAHLGDLVLVYSNRLIRARFLDAVRGAALVGSVVVAVLLWLSWYWGRRIAVPLVTLAERIRGLGRELPEPPDPGLYTHKDELGDLFDAFARVVGELRAKAALEKEMVKSERLAAVGRLAAGIAHEVNNPLAGMLTALDTLTTHGVVDERTRRTVALLERGLQQIRETVAALLVEGKVKSRDFAPQDVGDVQTLLSAPMRDKALAVEWQCTLPPSLPLPSSLVRQLLINLMLNAIQAAERGGRCRCSIDGDGSTLRLATVNDGPALSAEQLEHLYEPFSAASGDSGHGLGLWVSYQIVRQLGGSIRHRVDEGLTRFDVELPVERVN